jgi:serine/threonine protein kinase
VGDPEEDDETRANAGSATKVDGPSRKSNPAIPTGPDFGPRYRLIGGIGKGGMGEVFHAYDTELRDEVAIKVVRADQSDPDASLARFRREIALARKVTSPNVLRVYDLAEHAGLRFLSMQFVDGENLAMLLKREKQLPLERAITMFRQVCLGVAAAHEQGVIHRDLKPQNVLVDLSSLRRSVGVHDLDHSHGRRRAEPAHDFVALLDDRADLEIEIRGQWRHRVSLHDAGMHVTRGNESKRDLRSRAFVVVPDLGFGFGKNGISR